MQFVCCYEVKKNRVALFREGFALSMVAPATIPEVLDLPVPIIDLQDPKAAAAIRDACTEHGFFYGAQV